MANIPFGANSSSLFGSETLVPGGAGNPGGSNIPGMPNASTVPFSGTSMFTANGTTDMSATSFGAPGASTGGFSGVDIKNLNDTFGGNMGDFISQLMSTGGFNPQIAAAFINAMQPSKARGTETIMNEFGDNGLRFSSAAVTGLGDYLSQFNSQEMATLAQLQNSGIDRSFGLLQSILGPLQATRANQMSPWDYFNAVRQTGTDIAGAVAPALGL